MIVASLVLLAALPAASLAQQPLKDPAWTLQKFEWSEPLGASTTIEVRNPFGEIRARRAADDRVQLLSNIQRQVGDRFEPDFRIERTDATLRIVVAFAAGPESAPAPQTRPVERRADVTVLVPAGARLVAETGLDLVEAKGLRGDVEVTTVSGEIRVSTTGTVHALTDRGRITASLGTTGWSSEPRFRSSSSDIAVWLPAAADATVRAETAGEITTDFSLTIERPAGGRHKIATAVLGKGGPLVHIESEIGAVKILRLDHQH